MIEVSGKPLPSGWVLVSLRELLLPAPTTNPRARPTERFAYIDIEAVDNRLQRIGSPRELAGVAAPSRARNQVAPGDVIFSLVRPYLKNIAIVPSGSKDPVASTAFFVCRPAKGVDSRFLFNFLRQNSFIESIVTYGNSPPSARDDEFERLPVPIAPEPEQIRIADALDELLSDLDAGVKALEAVRAKFKQYRAAVLKAAVEGALTADWRKAHTEVEPAPVLLERILAERRRRWEEAQAQKYKDAGKQPPKNWKAKYKPPATPNTANLPPLPQGWCWATFSQLYLSIRSGCAETSGRVDTKWPVLKSSAVRQGKIDFQDLNYYPEVHKGRPENFLQRNDFLITRLSGSVEYVGCCAVVHDGHDGIQYPDRIFCAKVIEPVDPTFLTYCFQATGIRRELEAAAKSTAGHQRISLTDLHALVLPLPPYAEQSTLVEVVEDQLSVIDHLDADLDTKLRSAAALRQSILNAAFEGELVPQDPNDEPASELLKRIAVERAETERLLNQANNGTRPVGGEAKTASTGEGHGPVHDR